MFLGEFCDKIADQLFNPRFKCKELVNSTDEDKSFIMQQPQFETLGCRNFMSELFPETTTAAATTTTTDETVEIETPQIQAADMQLATCRNIVEDPRYEKEGKAFFMQQVLFINEGCNNENILSKLFPDENDAAISQEVTQEPTVVADVDKKEKTCRSIINSGPIKGRDYYTTHHVLFKGESCHDTDMLSKLFDADGNFKETPSYMINEVDDS